MSTMKSTTGKAHTEKTPLFLALEYLEQIIQTTFCNFFAYTRQQIFNTVLIL